MDNRLLTEQKQKALFNIPEKGYINRLLAARDKEWIAWAQSQCP